MIGDKTMLQTVIDNCKESKLIDKVIVATPHHIEFENADWFIGNENDVLDRFYQCALKFKSDIIVRVTSDCPLVQGFTVDTAIKFFRSMKLPYIKFALVNGLDVEVFTFGILEKAWNNAKTPYDREHVTPFMKEATKLSVDTKEDLERIREWINAGNKPLN
ncbi:hypothetical protein LCGC14_2336630 [marine sediment metagenome]|uniref:MobA-like NTP transferase domain-containing protein n=1 Tax=marine sediment metagenome TaxID=412755 RepID=A0A0F9CE61_9ZZZZ